MTRILWYGFAGWLPLLVFATAWASDDPSNPTGNQNSSPDLPSVTVLAPRPPRPEELAGNSVDVFVSSHGAASLVTGQLGRWKKSDGICPMVYGESADINQQVSDRILAVASAAGAPRAGRDCKVNVQVIFSSEPQQLTDELFKKGGGILFGYHFPAQSAAVKRIKYPIQAWYFSWTQGENAVAVSADVADLDFTAAASACDMHCPHAGGYLGSRLDTGLNTYIAYAMAMIDARKLAGFDPTEVADYVAMLVLSPTRPPTTCGQLPSILDLFAANCDDRAKAQSITAGDLAFLRALYSVDLRTTLTLEQSSIDSAMRREFQKAH